VKTKPKAATGYKCQQQCALLVEIAFLQNKESPQKQHGRGRCRKRPEGLDYFQHAFTLSGLPQLKVTMLVSSALMMNKFLLADDCSSRSPVAMASWTKIRVQFTDRADALGL
jgi:hypothetical protein